MATNDSPLPPPLRRHPLFRERSQPRGEGKSVKFLPSTFSGSNPLSKQPSTRRYTSFRSGRSDQGAFLIGHPNPHQSATLPPCCRSSATTL